MEHGFSQGCPSFSLFFFFKECRSHHSTRIIIWSPVLPRKHHSLFSSPPQQQQPVLTRSFISPNPLLFLGFSDNISCGHVFPGVDNGSRFFAMRHGKRVPKLNRPPDQRRALLRGLTTTTRARASAMRKYVDKMITLAKDGSLHKRRQASFMKSRLSMPYLLRSPTDTGNEMVDIPEL